MPLTRRSGLRRMLGLSVVVLSCKGEADQDTGGGGSAGIAASAPGSGASPNGQSGSRGSGGGAPAWGGAGTQGSSHAGSGAASSDAGAAGNGLGACTMSAECRLFDDYCTGCDCRALSETDPDPSCSGPGVRCLVAPCRDRQATCTRGRCVVSSP